MLVNNFLGQWLSGLIQRRSTDNTITRLHILREPGLELYISVALLMPLRNPTQR